MRKLILIALLIVSIKKSIGQGYEVGGNLGPRTKTDILMIGTDQEYFYNVRIDRDKSKRYGSLEANNVSDLKKAWSIGYSPDEFDEKFIGFYGIYLSDVGVVYFYTRKGPVSYSFELVQARFIPEGKGKWDTKIIMTLNNPKGEAAFDVKQNDKKGFEIVGHDRIYNTQFPRSSPIAKVVQLDSKLNLQFESDLNIPEKSLYTTIFGNGNYVYFIYKSRGTDNSEEKVMVINIETRKINTFNLWTFDKEDKNRRELELENGYLGRDGDNIVLCFKTTIKKDGPPQSMCGFGFITFDPDGNLVSKKEFSLPETYLSSDKRMAYGYYMESFDVLNDNTYRMILEDNSGVSCFEINNNKIQRFNKFKRFTSIHDDVNVYYTKQVLVDTKDKVRVLYNKNAESINAEDEFTKKYWDNYHAIYGFVNEDGIVREKDLNIVIAGNKNCQIQPTQSIVLDNKDVITVVASGENIYWAKIMLSK